MFWSISSWALASAAGADPAVRLSAMADSWVGNGVVQSASAGPRRQQYLELAGALERAELVRTADVARAEEDLGNGTPAAALDHLGAPRRLGLDVDLGPGDAPALEQRTRAVAIRAPPGRGTGHRGA